MPEERSKSGGIRDCVFEALKKHEPEGLSFTEILKYVEHELGRRCADRVIVYNLDRFSNSGRAYKDKKGKWHLEKKYLDHLRRETVINSLESMESVDRGESHLAPVFRLGQHGLSEEFQGSISGEGELDNAAQEEVHTWICELIWGEKVRRMVLGFAARCIWQGFNFSGKEEIDDVLEAEKQQSIMKLEDILTERLLPRTAVAWYLNLTRWEDLAQDMLEGMELAILGLEKIKKSEGKNAVSSGETSATQLSPHLARLMAISLAKELGQGIASPDFAVREKIGDLVNTINEDYRFSFNIPDAEGIEKKVRQFYEGATPEIQAALERWKKLMQTNMEGPMGGVAGSIAYNIVKTLPNDLVENMKWLNANKDKFLEFINKVKDIRFAQAVIVGCPEVEHWPVSLWVKELVDHLLKNLEIEKWDWGYRWTHFKDIARVAGRIVRRMASPKFKGEQAVDFELTAHEKYSFRYVCGGGYVAIPTMFYEHDQRTRKREWWEAVRDKAKRIAEINKKKVLQKSRATTPKSFPRGHQ